MALLKATTRTILLLVLQATILILCIVYIQAVYYRNILPDKLANKQYATSSCVVLTKQLETQGKLIKRYRARFEISFIHNNISYTAVTYGNGLDKTFTTDKNSQNELLNKFNLKENYPCWVNPNPPHQAILVLRHDWESIFSMFIPSLLFLIVVYAFTKTLFKFLRKKYP